MPLSIKKLPKSVAEIEGEIPAEDFERYYKDALKELNEKSAIPGFRAGHVPENILIEKIGDDAVLEHAAEHALQNEYPKILEENKIDAVGHPQIMITKIARKNPLGFKISVAVLPEIKLPDYKNLAKNIMTRIDEIKVEEKEIEEAIGFLRKSKTKNTENTESSDSDGRQNQITEDQKPEKPGPEGQVNDEELAKSFGQPDIGSLKKLLEENIKQDKIIKARESRRMEILDRISVSTNIEIPEVLITSEKEKMSAELRSSIENMGLKWEDYLAHIKKTEEELKKDWANEAEKRARYALVLSEIANLEKIEPSEAELNDFVEKTIAQSAGWRTESERKKIDKERVKDYAYGILRNEKVFQFLENYQHNK